MFTDSFTTAVRRRAVLVTGMLIIGLAACSSSAATTSTISKNPVATSPNTQGNSPQITWKICGKFECGTLNVPYDYNAPDIGTFSLHLLRRTADEPSQRIGSLLVNPGGPGFGGASVAENAEYYLSQTLLSNFDIIGWDPRGTGSSTPRVDCIDSYDEYFAADNTPNNQADIDQILALTKKFVDECKTRSGKILPYISTQATAHDMDTIRAALGEKKISYFGFSYGSELGATWATMFPDTVRAAVLDGASDPTADAIQGALQQAAGFEKALNVFLKKCAANKKCLFYNNANPGAALDRLISGLDDNPLVVSANRPPVNQTVAYTAIAQAMYSDSMWPDLERALSDAQKGKGAGLLSLNDQYFQRNSDGTYGNELEAFIAISCLDEPGPLTVAEIDATNDQFLAVAPRLGPSFIHSYTCMFWPAPQATHVVITGKGAGPIVVIGTSGDAATPIESSRSMAKALEGGIFLQATADQHTGYGSNACVVDPVDTYLITLEPPSNNLTC